MSSIVFANPLRRVKSALSGAAALALLAGCGGGDGGDGGGAAGWSQTPYKLHMYAEPRADGTPKTDLPLNIGYPHTLASLPVANAANGSYTAAIYVDVDRGNRPIPTDDYACTLVQGVEVVDLYYEDEVKQASPGISNGVLTGLATAHKSLVLPANSGAASFLVHARNSVGTARIRCTMGEYSQAEIVIRVGSNQSGPPGAGSNVWVNTSSRGHIDDYGVLRHYLLPQNSGTGRSQLILDARIEDHRGQPVPNPAGNNLFVRILEGPGAMLRPSYGGMNNNWVKAASINGQADFTLQAGHSAGAIDLEFVTDGSDNNVDNGIDQPVTNRMRVWVLDSEPAAGTAPELEITPDQHFEARHLEEFMAMLELRGSGTPMHNWRLINGSTLPAGLTLRSDGLIIGRPTVMVSDHTFMVEVEDSSSSRGFGRGNSIASALATISVGQSQYQPGLAECAGNVPGGANTVCELIVPAMVDRPYMLPLTGTGGDGNYRFTVVSPAADSNGLLHGFLRFDPAAATLRADQVGAQYLRCTRVELGNDGDPDGTVRYGYEYSDASYDLILRIESAGIVQNQMVRLRVTGGESVSAGRPCSA